MTSFASTRMAGRRYGLGVLLVAILACHGLASIAEISAQERRPQAAPSGAPTGQPPAHPLTTPLAWARKSSEIIDGHIRDYTCTLYKRKLSDGKLSDYEVIHLKVRHEPFSVYMLFQSPGKVKGREILFVEGRNNGKFVVHEGSGFTSLIGSVNLKPSKKYPVHTAGIKYLTTRLINIASKEMAYGECQVRYFPESKIGDQVAFGFEVVHPVRREHFRSNVARVFFDKKFGVPFRYESYVWPNRAGERPVLAEEYTYHDLKVNVGLTDRDFDRRNPKYKF